MTTHDQAAASSSSSPSSSAAAPSSSAAAPSSSAAAPSSSAAAPSSSASSSVPQPSPIADLAHSHQRVQPSPRQQQQQWRASRLSRLFDGWLWESEAGEDATVASASAPRSPSGSDKRASRVISGPLELNEDLASIAAGESDGASIQSRRTNVEQDDEDDMDETELQEQYTKLMDDLDIREGSRAAMLKLSARRKRFLIKQHFANQPVRPANQIAPNQRSDDDDYSIQSMPSPDLSPSSPTPSPPSTLMQCGSQAPPPPPPPPPPPSMMTGIWGSFLPLSSPPPMMNEMSGPPTVMNETSEPPPPPPPPTMSEMSRHSLPMLNEMLGPPPPAPPPPPPPPMMSGMSGPPPPPPPPPPVMNGIPRPPPPPGAIGMPSVKEKRRVALMWSKLPMQTVVKTVWNELPSDKIDLSVEEVDGLFSMANVNPDARLRLQDGDAAAAKKQATLINLQRAQNIAILLSRIRMSYAQIRASLLQVDTPSLTLDNLLAIRSCVPTQEEQKLIRDFQGDIVTLSKADQFINEMLGFPKLQQRLDCMIYMRKFDEELEELRPDLSILRSATDEMRQCAKFKVILKHVLMIGNILNNKTFRGNAQGFALADLLKLRETRAAVPKPKQTPGIVNGQAITITPTLLHYLVKVLNREDTALIGFLDECEHVEAAARISTQTLMQSMAAMISGLECVEEQVSAVRKMRIPLEGDQMVNVGEAFLQRAKLQIEVLQQTQVQVVQDVTQLIRYYGEDEKSTKPEDFFGIVGNFGQALMRAEVEVKENETRAAQREKQQQQQQQRMMAAGIAVGAAGMKPMPTSPEAAIPNTRPLPLKYRQAADGAAPASFIESLRSKQQEVLQHKLEEEQKAKELVQKHEQSTKEVLGPVAEANEDAAENVNESVQVVEKAHFPSADANDSLQIPNSVNGNDAGQEVDGTHTRDSSVATIRAEREPQGSETINGSRSFDVDGVRDNTMKRLNMTGNEVGSRHSVYIDHSTPYDLSTAANAGEAPSSTFDEVKGLKDEMQRRTPSTFGRVATAKLRQEALLTAKLAEAEDEALDEASAHSYDYDYGGSGSSSSMINASMRGIVSGNATIGRKSMRRVDKTQNHRPLSRMFYDS